MGKSRTHEESPPAEVGLGADKTCFILKNYNNPFKEFSLANTLENADKCDINSSSPVEDLSSSNIRHVSSPSVSPFYTHFMFG